MKTLKYCIITGLFLFHSNQSFAHSLTGSLADNPQQILGNTTNTVDYYQVTCFNDNGVEPAGLVTHVKDLTADGSTRVGVHVQKNGAQYPSYMASSSTDKVDSDEIYSDFGAVVGEAGVYDVLVTKDGEGNQNYSLEYHCLDWNGQHAGTDLNIQQNQ